MNYNFDSMLLQTIGNIISMRSVPQITELANEEGFSPLIANYTLPSFSILETHQRRDFLRRCGTARNFFMDYPVQFSYSDECINFLISKENSISPKLASFYNRFILFSFLSWMQNYLTSETDDYILHLMKALLIYHNTLNIDCFFSLYYIVIQKRPVTLFQSIYPIINIVFNEIKDIPLPEYAYSFLPFHFGKLFRNEEENAEKDDQTATEKGEHFNQNAETMMNFVILLLIDQTSQITTQVALEFYETIKTVVIDKFELRGMTFFANLSGFLPYETKVEAISEFPQKIIQSIESNSEPYIQLPSKKAEVKSYNLSSIATGHFSFSKEYISFPNGLGEKTNFLSSSLRQTKSKSMDEMKIVNFPLVVFSNICDNILVSLLSFISKSIGDKNEERENLLKVFLKNFYSLIETRPIDQYSDTILASYLIFCQINEKTKLMFDLTPMIFKYNVWSPEYTIFINDSISFEGINALRHFSLDFTLNQKTSVIDDFLKEIFKNPVITAEVTERLMNIQNFSLLLKALVEDNHLMKTVCFATCSFVQDNSENYDKDLDMARYSLFRLLSKLMKEPTVIPLLYNNTLFLSFFFSLLFEIQMQDYVLSEIKMYLIDGCDDYIYENFTESFSHLFEQTLQHFITSKEGQDLSVKIIQTLLDVFEFKPKFAKTFSFIIQPFFDAIEEINIDNSEKKKEKTFEYIELIFKYFEFLDHRDISMNIIVFMKDLIVSKRFIDCDDNLFNLIKNKMVKNDIIVQPLLAHLMVLCFWTERYKEIVKLFTEFCQINSLNSVALHEAEIDSFIVDELKSSTLTDEEITERLNLLEQISIVISSPIIVQNFISLLKGNTNYLYFLNKLIVLNYSIPIAILPFYVVIENEFSTDHQGSFSTVVWLYLESDKNYMTLFRINDNDEILIFIKGIQLFVNNAYIFDLPVKKWFFLALTFNAKDKSIIGYVNMNVVKVLQDQTDNVSLMIDWENLHLKKYTIGDPDSLTGRYGNFGFFPDLQKINVRYFVEAGPRNIAVPQIPAFEYFTPRKISDIRAAFLKTAEISNFAEIFLQICKIELILPLFAQLNDNKDRLNQIFRVLRNSLLIDESQQKYFQEIMGFAIITHLLISTHFKGLTFDFYMKFFNLCQEIANEKLRNDLIRDVLINFELWTRSPEFLQITNHWKTVLFAGFEFISQNLIKFYDLLNLMRIYLYYTPVETKIIRPGIDIQTSKISEIRMNIIEILINQYEPLIENYDYALIMYQLISCEDVQQIHDILLFFTHLAENPSKVLIDFMINTELTVSLQILLISNDQLIVPTVLSIIRNFHRAHLFKVFSFVETISVFFHQLKYSKLSAPVLQKMIGLVQNDIPELFPVCCYFSLMLELNNNKENQPIIRTISSNGSSIFMDIFETIEPSKILDTGPMWAIWAIYGAIMLDNVSVLSFLAQCGDSKWLYLFSLIDRICQVFNFKGDLWKQRFINIVADIIEARDPATYSPHSPSQQQQQNQQQQGSNQQMKAYPFMENFLDLVAFFIFFRRHHLHNPALIKLYKDELGENAEMYEPNKPYAIPYSDSNTSNSWLKFLSDKPWLTTEHPEFDPHENENKHKQEDEDQDESVSSKLRKIMFDVEEIIIDTNFIEERYVFGLRLTEDEEWLDKDLAIKTTRIIDKFSVKSHKNLIFLLDKFINRKNTLITEDIAESILKKPLITHPYELFRLIREQSEKILERSRHLFSYNPDPLENYGANRLDETKQTILNGIDNASKNWRFLWSHMTIDHAPWDISSNANKKHYRRDFSLNSFMCPWKTKINRKFDIHEHASKMRDSGNFEEEKPKVRPINLHPLSIIEDEMISKNKETLAVNDNDFIFSHECEVIKISKVINTTFSINANYIKVLDKIYKIDDIKHVFWRRLKQYPTAIEIFFINGKTLFLNFPGLQGKAVARQIASFSPKNAIYIQQTDFDIFFQHTKLTEKWQNRQISNFEYLMNLNIFGGRSFNDPSQYPFLPWILSNYSSQSIDLNDKRNYRDLTKPVGALGDERLKELIQRLSDLKYFNITEFLFSSYASTPLSVFLFNLRVEPYTTQHILMQGGRFDTPLRQFFSVERTFDSVVTQMNDYRELTPEFFYDNEFLINLNNFDLGEVRITLDDESDTNKQTDSQNTTANETQNKEISNEEPVNAASSNDELNKNETQNTEIINNETPTANSNTEIINEQTSTIKNETANNEIQTNPNETANNETPTNSNEISNNEIPINSNTETTNNETTNTNNSNETSNTNNSNDQKPANSNETSNNEIQINSNTETTNNETTNTNNSNETTNTNTTNNETSNTNNSNETTNTNNSNATSNTNNSNETLNTTTSNTETNTNDSPNSTPSFKKHKSFGRVGSSLHTENSYTHSISNVELPPWAKDSPFDFIYLNRKALESDIVSDSLHKWIDLIFGINQKGQGAIDNFNTYKEEMYDDIWEKNQDYDDLRRIEIETIIEQVGQIPPQLFKTEHPPRNKKATKMSMNDNSNEIYCPNTKWNLSDVFVKNLNVGILFSTIHLINKNIVQFRMITSSHQIQIVDVELMQSTSNSEEKIEVNVISRKDLPNEVSQEDVLSFTEVDKNVLLFLANSSLDAFVINLDSFRIQRINERRQKITTVSSAKAQEFSKKLKLNMFSLSFDDSRTNIYFESAQKVSSKEATKTGFISNLPHNFGFNLTSTTEMNANLHEQNTAVVMNDASSHTRRSRKKIQKASSTRIFANVPSNEGNIQINSSSSNWSRSSINVNNEVSSNENKNAKVDKSGSFGIFSSIFSNLISDDQTGASNLTKGNENDDGLITSSRPVSYQKVIQRDRYYTLKYSVPTYRKSILCSALSVTFGVSISGTDDGSLIVASIHDGSAIRAIKLNDQRIPIFILITPAWGFIFVNSSKYVNGRQKFFLSLYTINGDEIKTIPVDFSIEKAISWSNESGFDFIALLTKSRNKIIAFEAFYMNVSDQANQLFKSDQKIASFNYLKKVGALFAVTISGSLVIIPYLT